MGVLNVTPDSFSDGGKFTHIDRAIEQALTMFDHGADIIDIGGESTRPGAKVVDEKTELSRVLPVIKALSETKKTAVISIDTRRPLVAAEAVNAGASIWNDVTALSFDDRSPNVAAGLGCDVILMHMQGDPKTMQKKPQYEQVVDDVKAYLSERAQVALDSGVQHHQISLDPGIGFGKRLQDNLDLLQNIDAFHALGYPILIGTSRKSFIGKIDGSLVDDRLGGSLASALWAESMGASILRVHDVKETAQAVKVWRSIRERDHV
ncbi:MAG: dihydropteroate synthase [Acidimicrobiales bacterium]|nr:dihydropteroate synthase [Hyphomonadaceae bacterium]RZV43671.1 MAG: dihydropteroate synthase [Acidimicrobiales bacterium]